MHGHPLGLRPAAGRRRPARPSGRSARRTTPSPTSRWSAAASSPRPGEISLAHNGVLFLDEMPEFDRRVLEVLRQPLEEGRVTIARAARTAVFPARFMLVAAMNPCPCGFLGDPTRVCRCTPREVERYRGRLSGPLRDRLDLIVDVPAVPAGGARRRRGRRRRRRRFAAARARARERRQAHAGPRRASPSTPSCRDAAVAACRPRPRRPPAARAGGAAPWPQRPRLRPRAEGGANDRGPRRTSKRWRPSTWRGAAVPDRPCDRAGARVSRPP